MARSIPCLGRATAPMCPFLHCLADTDKGKTLPSEQSSYCSVCDRAFEKQTACASRENAMRTHPLLPRDSRGGMQGHVLVPICVGHRGVRQKGHESSRDNKEPFCLKYTVLGSSPKLSMAGSLVLRPWSLQRI